MRVALPLDIRPARLADALDIAALHHVAVHRLAAGFYEADVLGRWSPPVTVARAERVYREAQEAGGLTLIAESEGEIAGFGTVRPADGEISACYVAPEQARKGVGRRLVDAMERTALASGARALRVRAGRNARSFYTALGYRVGGRGEHLFDDGTRMVVVLLEKDLAPIG